MFDLASTLFGNRRNPVAQGSSLTATGSAASENGTAYLVMDADVTPAEGVGDDTDQTVIDVPTSPSVAEGDEVIMTLVGDGPLKTPIVTANPGSGDRMAAAVQEAAEDVEQVRQDVADFRSDVATTYATKVEREDGDDAVKTWVTTNYTNSNDLATTYATKTLVSQTKDAIELAASQTYETQSDAAATYATKSALTVGLDGIRTEVAEDYQPKGDYATTASMNSAIQQSASSIESSVEATYLKQSDASTTYATKTEVQQTASGLDTRITTAQSTADRAYLERSGTGTTIDTTGAATIRSLVVEGQSVQDGTPTPSAPVPIVSVESRNLATTEVYRKGYLINADGTETASANQQISAAVPVTGGETYHVSYSCAATFNDACRIGWYTNQMVFISRKNVSKAGGNITAPSNAAYLRYCRGWNAANPSNYIYDLQIERGTTAHPYQPYGCVTLVAGSTRTDIDLQGHALRSLPDGTHDEMRVDSLGRVTMTQRVGSVTFDGSETWTLSGGPKARVNTNAIINLIRRPANNQEVLAAYSDHFVGATDAATYAGTVGVSAQTSGYVGFTRTGQETTVADWTAWLTANPTTVLYPLATPQEIDLGKIDLPAPADTLWLDAAIVPTIGATWWTVGGIAGQQALDAEVTERQTLIRQFSGGVLAGYVGNAIAALVNAAGSFDVVRTAWSGGVPSILGTLARYAASGISLFDAAGNVLAEFASDHVRIGGDVPIGDSEEVGAASVQFFDQTSTHTSHMDASTYFDGDGSYQTMQSTVNLSSTLADEGKAIDTGSSGTAALDLVNMLENGISATDEQHNEVHAALVADASYSDGATTSHAAVRATASTLNGSGLSYVELIADALGIGENEGAIDYFTMDAVRSAFPVTLYDNASASASAAASLSETAANYSRLTIFFKDNDGNHSSADVWAPDGKRVALAITWISGASTQEMYQRVRWVTISGTSISTYKASGDAKYRTGQVRLGGTYSVTNGDYISIVHVIGWR